MTDAERRDLDCFMAEKVMGWTWLLGTGRGGRPRVMYGETVGWLDGSAKLVAAPDWSPTTDPRATSQVMARLVELGWEVTIVVSADGVLASLERDETLYLELIAPTWTEALCLAAKQAMEAQS